MQSKNESIFTSPRCGQKSAIRAGAIAWVYKPANLSEIDAGELRNQFNGLKALLDAQGVPVGCVLAYLKNLSGVPASPTTWAECNGQVLSDAGSPLNGQTLPNLNGANRFLRGAGVSGGSGGSDFLTITSEVPVDNNADASTTTVVAAPQPDLPILPSYYEVVWVMRVR